MSVRFINTGGGGSGTVSVVAGSGTVGRVPRFNSATTLADTFITATGALIYSATGALQIPTGQLLTAQGSSASPAWSFVNDTNTGVYNRTDGALTISNNGTVYGEFRSSQGLVLHGLANGLAFGSGDAGTAVDTGIDRPAAGVVRVNTGAGSAAHRDLQLRDLLGFDVNGTNVLRAGPSGVFLGSQRSLSWNSGDSSVGTPEISIGRTSSNNLSIKNSAGADYVTIGATGIYVATGLVRVPAGSAAAPVYSFSEQTNAGTYSDGSTVRVSVGGADRALFGTAGFQILDSGAYYYGLSSPDLAHKRNAAGMLAINNGGTTNLLLLGSSGILLGSNRQVAFTPTPEPNATPDASLGRAAAGLLQVTDGAGGFGALRVGYDAGSGVASSITLTGANNITVPRSTGVGTIKFDDGTSRDSVGFVKMYVGQTAVFIPAFAAD